MFYMRFINSRDMRYLPIRSEHACVYYIYIYIYIVYTSTHKNNYFGHTVMSKIATSIPVLLSARRPWGRLIDFGVIEGHRVDLANRGIGEI